MKTIFAAALIGLSATVAQAQEMIMKPSPYTVSETMDALVAAVEGAGAQVEGRVDHSGAAADVDLYLPDAELLIFGNPQVGTPAMQANILAGLYLPLRVLVYQDEEGVTQVAYEPAADIFAGIDIAADAEYMRKINGALGMLTDKAVAE